MFKIGDKVRLKPEEIKYYHDNPDHDWTYQAEKIFVSGRVFKITDIQGKSIYIDGGVGGSWDNESFMKYDSLPGDLFVI